MKTTKYENFVISAAIVAFILIIVFYAANAYVFNWQFPKEAAVWGPIGDFFGGILNPVVAFCALVLLYSANAVQRKEIQDARTHFEKESKLSEISRVVFEIEKEIQDKLKATVQHRMKNEITGQMMKIGVLELMVSRGWNPVPGQYIKLDQSDLETQIKDYFNIISERLELLSDFVEKYNQIAGGNSELSNYIILRYSKLYEHCVKIGSVGALTEQLFKSDNNSHHSQP